MKAIDCKTYTDYIECRNEFKLKLLIIATLSVVWFAIPILLGMYVQRELFIILFLTISSYVLYWVFAFLDGPRNVWFVGINRIRKSIANREHLKQLRKEVKS